MDSSSCGAAVSKLVITVDWISAFSAYRNRKSVQNALHIILQAVIADCMM